MNERNSTSRRIIVLREDVSKKIAAGEVIERPFSVVRELLDNSIDAESSSIDLYIYGGGIKEIRVVDDGAGMNLDDLKICYYRHTTSKIVEEDDLYRTMTLGFRGEALASIATCSRLEIVSFEKYSDNANRLIVHGGKLISIGEYAGKRGTSVRVSDLFFNMPARRRFLKSISSETFMCRSIFLDRALPFTEAAFRLFIDDRLRYFFPVQTLKERVCAAYSELINPSLLIYKEMETKNYKLKVVAGDPSLVRRDRKLVQIFINGRRVNDYSLMQAVEYAYTGYVPGGYHPVCFAFLKIHPELVDFNIHPAKKEVKLKDISSLRQGIIGLIAGELCKLPVREHKLFGEGDLFREAANAGKGEVISKGSFRNYDTHNVRETASMQAITEAVSNDPGINYQSDSVKYLGQVFGVFLIVFYGNRLYLIDQHAAHERIIFDELMKKEYSPQILLLPIDFKVTEEEEGMTEKNIPLFKGLGIGIEKKGKGSYVVNSMPEDFLLLETDELIRFLREDAGDIARIKRKIMDTLACRLAVKDGDKLDEITAVELARKALKLEVPKCPHGRPIWFSLTKDELFKIVKRV
ncbi:MAG: DNA mismatch repair endonuclease MutL [Spirochaetales bacterium]|nr:DNA mismatch repair endonuclease MutL [Spirochaetales bacterium]